MNPPRDRIRGEQALLRFLQRQGRISAGDARRFEQMATKEGLSVNELLDREGIISETDLALLLAHTLRL
ncbi:MAG: hypothetical protein ACHQ4J_02680, partial [Candidatus Binatia bacterium]